MPDKLPKWRDSLRAFAPLFLWTGVIFVLSGSHASMDDTSRILGPLLRFLFPSASAQQIAEYNFYIRKLAHFTEYAILGLFAVRAFAGNFSRFLQDYRSVSALFVVLAVASLDEIHQSFEPNRTSSFNDVLLDFAGGLAMVLFLLVLGRLRVIRA